MTIDRLLITLIALTAAAPLGRCVALVFLGLNCIKPLNPPKDNEHV